jgi:hypothetical protein
MKHVTITVKSELKDIEPYLNDILTTLKNHDEITGVIAWTYIPAYEGSEN